MINAILKAVSGLTDAPGSPNLKMRLRSLRRRGCKDGMPPIPTIRRCVTTASLGDRRDGLQTASVPAARGATRRASTCLIRCSRCPKACLRSTATTRWSRVNDGLVTVQSAKWGKFLGCVPADHLDEVGQMGHLFPDVVSGFSHKELYRKIVAELRKDGL